MIKNQYNKDGKPHGYWEEYHLNGNISYKGNYKDGNRHGYWEYYWSNGSISYKGNWKNFKPYGYWERYTSPPRLHRKEFHI